MMQERAAPRVPDEDRTTDGPASLLRPGDTCLCVRHAKRLRVLVDGAAYFAALREAIVRARHSVFIVGWDIDSRMHLVPGDPPDGLPRPLGDFLCAVAAANPQLHVRILAWDFAMLYAMEREWLPSYKLGWRTPRRVSFRLDGRHPPGASHHQKIVVIDDCVAFVGGIDVTRSRWDTPAHAPREPLRRNGPKLFYTPTHDVQAMFDDDAATAVGALVRERWRRAGGRHATLDEAANSPDARAAASPCAAHDPWPPGVTADIEDVELGISITEPPFAGRPPSQHIRALYLAAIAAARENVYIENQYFTASAVGDALAARLAAPDGPSVAVVVPREQTGWLQAATMGTLRARLYRRLDDADAHGRLKMYFPWIDGLGDAFINVHSKLMVVDNDLLVIGSANLNNRSMVLDSECNVTLEARGDTRVSAMIASVRNRLLAEHLDVPQADVDRAFARGADIHRVIDDLRHDGRTLERLEPSVSPDLDRVVPEAALIDPETPAAPDEVVRQFVPGSNGHTLAVRVLVLGALALAALAMTIAWKHTALSHLLSLEAIGHFTRALSASRFGPPVIVGAYALAAVASVPITVLIALAGLLFGPVAGSAYALAGTLIAAVVTYYIGVWAGRDAVRQRAGTRLNRLSERMGKQGIVAVVVLRVVPLAPFMLVNLAAGASHIGLRDYLIGTALGMGPGIVLAATFANQLVTVVRHPSPGPMLLLAAIGIALVGGSVALQRLFAKRGR
ncbi:MAG TPA: VTT domain-containing protein [Paraburkholderia sp.]|jgi:phospholipase D1/2|nr:VTT domain-containing protein [Paraburkholderia sp.]